MKNKSVIIFTLCAASIFFVSCGSKDKTETASPETETHVDEHANPDEATLTADQIKLLPVIMQRSIKRMMGIMRLQTE